MDRYPLARRQLAQTEPAAVVQQSVVDLRGADPQAVAIAGHWLIDLLDPVAARTVGDLATAARHMAEPGGKSGWWLRSSTILP